LAATRKTGNAPFPSFASSGLGTASNRSWSFCTVVFPSWSLGTRWKVGSWGSLFGRSGLGRDRGRRQV